MTITENAEVKRGVILWTIKGFIYLMIFGIDLFVPADDWGWGMAWIYLSIYAINNIVLTFILPPELLAERSKRQEGSKKWDTGLAVGAAVLMPMAIFIVAGLDRGEGWTTTLPFGVQLVALVVMILGIVFTDWAMLSNKFFSGLVRIQEDRGHVVQSSGPYRLMRHPGYVGGIVHHLTAPLMLGSWWALIPGLIGTLLFVIRTGLEDKTLHAELPGYAEYAQQTRYRLVPGIW
jgi:protein-S-isoprenylcysteine O-methyltransferase Ste14